MIQQSFSLGDQVDFAKLSGDYNPAHLDPIKARRMCFGQPIVHGIHVLFWALEAFFCKNYGSLKLDSLKASFNQPIGLNQTVQLIKKFEEKTCAEIQIVSKNQQMYWGANQ